MSVSSETRLRIIAMMSVLSTVVLLLVAQMFRWQVFERQALLERAEAEHQAQEARPIPARRGSIYDREGFLLASDTTGYNVSASPNMIADPDMAGDRIFRLVGLSREETIAKLRSDAYWVPLASRVSQSEGEKISQLGIIGVQLEPVPVRVYPAGSMAAHILGFVNANNTGFYGVEGYYDEKLQGVAGERQAERDVYGYALPIEPAHYMPPSDGVRLYLTIERTAQYIVEKELEDALHRYQAESGTVIVLDPKTGAIVAMASRPTFDPNIYGNIQSNLFTNPAVSEQYEPGSVFKLITVAAAIDSGVITPETTVYDSGAIEVGGRTIYNWDRASHGTVDVSTVLGKSLNVGSAQIAVMVGKDRFYNYIRRFGFGSLTEVDLDGESAGLLKTPGDPDWYESDLGTNSFGQGIAVTPLQMAVAVAAIANDGLLMKPYVVQHVVSGNEVRSVPPKVVRRAISAGTAYSMTEMMARVVDQETQLAQVPGYRVAGKSGTAQIPVPGGYHPSLTIASFVGYLPADDPAFVILVIIDKPMTSPWGGEVAAPVFARIAQQLVDVSDVPPDDVRRQIATQSVSWMSE